ncbi:MAG: hypothetical protein O3A95_06105 [Planctomycetota bacterium]|nr:hypothetical protein [Planctomycetota bacterium]MDA1113855.1 hypothetical protein [Planctomycetota bacterium]
MLGSSQVNFDSCTNALESHADGEEHLVAGLSTARIWVPSEIQPQRAAIGDHEDGDGD